jgi:hypothetical protein
MRNGFSNALGGRVRAARVREAGSAMLVAMLTLVALLTIGALSALSVQGDLRASGAERQKQIATYAAESGVAAGMEFLRQNLDANANWSAFVNPGNANPLEPNLLPGTGVQPGQTGNLFSAELRAWYRVSILNNVGDPGFAAGDDLDGRVILRATGFGPDGATAIVEVDLRAMGGTPAGRPCPVYGQRGIADDGAGRNDCLGIVNAGDSAVYQPGAP